MAVGLLIPMLEVKVDTKERKSRNEKETEAEKE